MAGQRMMEKPRKSRSNVLLLGFLCAPLFFSLMMFLQVCRIWKTDPERYLDSPGSELVGYLIAAGLASISVIGVFLYALLSGSNKGNNEPD